MRLPFRLPRPAARLVGFAGNERGAIALVLALAVVPAMLVVGASVDFARTYYVRSKLIAAADAAALAGASAFQSDARDEIIREYFSAAIRDGVIGAKVDDPVITIDEETGSVEVSASADVPMTLLELANIEKTSVSASSEARASVHAIEVVMVLDNTGSMGGSKIRALRSSAKELVDIVMPKDDDLAKKNVRIGLVPFTTTVRVDRRDWMVEEHVLDEEDRELLNELYNGCVAMRLDKMGWNDDPPDILGNEFEPYDARPAGRAYDYGCNSRILWLTNDRDALLDRIGDMKADGNTAIVHGAAWGWRMLSPRWQGLWDSMRPEEPRDYDDPDYRKIVLILTDGNHDPLEEVDNLSEGQMDSRLTLACEAMKDEGIIVYSLMFDAPSSVREMFRNCASDTAKFLKVEGTDDLRTAFRRIAGEIREVYLSR